jgi:hypothetical protein
MYRTTNYSQSTFIIVCSSVLLLSLFIVSACNSSTSPQKGSLTGTVELVNDSQDGDFNSFDLAGILVAIYEPTALDTMIQRINQDYPSIGVDVDQKTEFDHRRSTPFAFTSTNSDGSFCINDIPFGNYNVVFIKQGWAIHYEYMVGIEGGSNEIGDIVMFPRRLLSGVIDDDYTFHADRIYFAEGECSILGDAIIEGGSKIYIQPGGSINFYGDVICHHTDSEVRYWTVSSDYGIYTDHKIDNFSEYYADKLTFKGPISSLKGGVIRQINNGCAFENTNASVEDIRINEIYNAITGSQSLLKLDKLCISLDDGEAISLMSQSGNFEIKDSIILGGRIGIRPYVPGGYLVSNNYLKSIGTAISTGGNNGVIKNNIFEDNDIDIYLYSSFATIHNNDFYNSRIQTIDMRYTTSEIHDNSFYSTSGLFFKLLSNPP